MLNLLSRAVLNKQGQQENDDFNASPITILQIGEGNFIRGFFDWMINECHKQGLYDGRISVMQPRPSGAANIAKLKEQDGLFTLVIRGLEDGEPVERDEIVNVFAEIFDPYSDWDAFLALAVSRDLQFVVSNTTEAGLVYQPEAYVEKQPILSFSGKMTLLLYERYKAFEGADDLGLIFLPCELLENNGDRLRDCVLRFAEDWGLPTAFMAWIVEHNRFMNSLVDRIVTGYPGDEQAGEWFDKWGYTDKMLSTAELYHLWAIEGESELEQKLPLKQAGLNVHWVQDLKPFQLRKVRILNGAHTLMTPLGILHGVSYVRELMEHPDLGIFIREAVENEILPTLPYGVEEMKDYANTVFERYLNPFILHRLSDIAMNSISKFKARLLPTLAYYRDNSLPLPERLVHGFAGLLRYYKVKQNVDGDGYEGMTFGGSSYKVRDDVKVLEQLASIWLEAERGEYQTIHTVKLLLGLTELWGDDLSLWPELAESINVQLMGLENDNV
ncbi:altronate oxidoreductase [Paenibacillus baekrokdamisoli]|uniref:Altronate oxidoreductase n=1 Tax=Paenibacillus baekrokdamisoli TaxID=1712516 RepID=A0A3G9JE01_9BACL|nr:tagaturonate reductase [Paenibacillus baekrokdamisoli]MBB3070423.1 tagaturonate reductase [Paenibacillus baekrokdamisoli]BBH21424.1 altronate oxidoreductase [Paenibacillus baekrokdamisoli]